MKKTFIISLLTILSTPLTYNAALAPKENAGTDTRASDQKKLLAAQNTLLSEQVAQRVTCSRFSQQDVVWGILAGIEHIQRFEDTKTKVWASSSSILIKKSQQQVENYFLNSINRDPISSTVIYYALEKLFKNPKKAHLQFLYVNIPGGHAYVDTTDFTYATCLKKDGISNIKTYTELERLYKQQKSEHKPK